MISLVSVAVECESVCETSTERQKTRQSGIILQISKLYEEKSLAEMIVTSSSRTRSTTDPSKNIMKRRKAHNASDLMISTSISLVAIKLLITMTATLVTANSQQQNSIPFQSQRLSPQANQAIPSYRSPAFHHSQQSLPTPPQNHYSLSDLQFNDNHESLREITASSMPLSSATSELTSDSREQTSGSQANLQAGNQHQSDNNVNSDSSAGIDEESSDNIQSEQEESADQSHEVPERNLFMDRHNSQLQAMHDLFERRQLNQHHHQHQIPSSQELNPIAIGLEPGPGVGSPFGMPPFQVPNHGNSPVRPPLVKAMANADNVDQGLGPTLPFGLNPLPHLLGFNSPTPFDGPQRGDQSTHSNIHSPMPAPEGSDGGTGTQKVWPKIFRFTDGRINLSEFEKQKKIRLSNKNQHSGENHIESAPIMFDGRQLKRKSFLILHGGIFSA